MNVRRPSRFLVACLSAVCAAGSLLAVLGPPGASDAHAESPPAGIQPAAESPSAGIQPAAESPPASIRPSVEPASAVDFERDVRPILARHCLRCHGAEKQESGLRLDSLQAALRGGDLGEKPIVPRNSGESALVQLLEGSRDDLKMPPEGEPRPTADEAAIVRTWIDQGATWPDAAAVASAAPPSASRHWSFQPLDFGPVPPATEVDLADWAATPIDRYLLASLAEVGLRPSPPASPEVLIRRLYLNLLGLPPSPEEVEEFCSDPSPAAYERLVDRLLASPRFGERAARHWLDVARFAETNGFETNTPRPSAYHYRDWAIESFNSDKPYDRFVFEQLAGDAVGVDAATGFLVGGPYDEVKSPDPGLTLMQRQNELADMVGTTGMAFLGLTVGCARCHNHKFDPISQQEYYALSAVFAGVRHGARPLKSERQSAIDRQLADKAALLDQARRRLAAMESASERARWEKLAAEENAPALRPPVSSRGNVDYLPTLEVRKLRFLVEATGDNTEPCIDELEVFGTVADGAIENVARLALNRLSSSGDYPGNEKHKLEHLTDGQYGNSRSWISNQPGQGMVQIDFAQPVRLDRLAWARDREGAFRDRLATRYAIEVEVEGQSWRRIADSADRLPVDASAETVLEHRLRRLPPEQREEAKRLIEQESSLAAEIDVRQDQSQVVYAGAFEQPQTTHRLFRGDPMQPREAVEAGALELGETLSSSLGVTGDAPEQQRRAALAQWIIESPRPLAARVAANRIWQAHFGVGLVATPSDFGANGAPPSHPRLLDWLANELIASGWSQKHLHRLIVLSRAYRQAATPRPEAMAKDADDRLLWRFPSRRLEAEAVRDSVLAASGELDLAMYGPGYSVFEPNDNYVRVYEPKTRFGRAERRRMVYMFKVRMEQDAIFGAFDCPDAGQPTARRGVSTTALQAMNLFNSPFMLEQAEMLAARAKREAGDDPAAQVNRAFLLALGRSADAVELAAAEKLAAEHGLAAVARALFNANEFVFLP